MNMTISSNPPGAEVNLITKAGTQPLGKTPLSVDAARLPNTEDGFALEIAKEGHFEQRVLVEKRAVESSGEIAVTLRPHPKFVFKKHDPDV
jgi:hypothetical protein